MIVKIRNSAFMRVLSLMLIFQMIMSFLPVKTYAITGGPTQPEFTSFTPVGVNDMVDIFSGDFQYNIPLLDVEGYPINLSYSSGIGMEDQASCVGLGWTLNAAGTINRSVRGIPDDFNGDDIVETRTNLRPNWTAGASLTLLPEVFGAEINKSKGKSSSMSMGFGVFYNNYTGIGYDVSASVDMSISDKLKMPDCSDLGFKTNFSFNSESGMSISPSLSLSAKTQEQKNNEISSFSGSIGAGASYNSRSGLRQASIVANVDKSLAVVTKTNKTNKLGSKSFLNGDVNIPVGTVTYIPQYTNSMLSYSVNLNFGTGSEIWWMNGKYRLGGYYSVQKLASTERSSPAYGYLHLEKGQSDKYAMLDFNREKDQAFQKRLPALAMTQLTYDIYNATGQGVSGMFRPFRETGTVFDAYVESVSTGNSLGFDVGATQALKLGVNYNLNYGMSSSGKWSNGNNSRDVLSFRKKSLENPIIETVYFKNAGEFTVIDKKDFEKMGGFSPVRIALKSYDNTSSSFLIRENVSLKDEKEVPISVYKKQEREKRNQTMSYLTAQDAANVGLQKVLYSYPFNGLSTTSIETIPRYGKYSNGRKAHHISEVMVNRPDGTRYVYGDQLYNVYQAEVTFNANGTVNGGLISYQSGVDDSKDNSNGVDHYYNKNVLPPYATTYLLTAILSSDYVDRGFDGPSVDDLGNYTKFNYTQLFMDGDNEDSRLYHWRNPYEKRKANYVEGAKSRDSDDKGTYLYGKKEIKLLHSIETKNYIAEFYYSDRDDAYEVDDKNGGRGEKTLKKLDKIVLFSRADREKNAVNAIPIKTVHFVYNYSLCPGIKSSINYDPDNTNIIDGGKLTLEEVYFTYGKSKKGMLSPYKFAYNNNPQYGNHLQDRWGNYKYGNENGLSNIDAPYVNQSSSTETDVAAWSLSSIDLPSGGKINVEYESDDYAFVQNKRATSMMNILGFSDNKNATTYSSSLYDPYALHGTNNEYVFFKAPAKNETDFQERYIGVGDSRLKELFFRMYMHLDFQRKSSEYVTGYVNIEKAEIGWRAQDSVAYIKLPLTYLQESSLFTKINPISRIGMQFVRLNMPGLIYGDYDEEPGIATVKKLTSFVPEVIRIISGVYGYMYGLNYCSSVDPSKSYLRLMDSDYKKKGGGLRVKKITMNDNWKNQSGNTTENFLYGQIYQYTKKADGKEGNITADTLISSGVATYEPFLGNEENPMRQPKAYKEENKYSQDNYLYQEEPYGEMFFPSPSVGYSNVKVTNLTHENVKRTATGFVEHEFYTAKDFPVIVKNPYRGSPKKHSPSIAMSLLRLNVEDYMTLSQSYAIELNNMHGKPKAQRVYAEGKSVPISEIEYYYKTEGGTLSNEISVINNSNKIEKALAGVEVELITDERESVSVSCGGGVAGNVDISLVPPFGIPLPVPSFWPNVNNETTYFRSITNTKIITRYGVLEKTIAKDLGSSVTTENLAWDKETGELLLTKTYNSFKDPVYSFTYPAHWAYAGMSSAYKNIGLEIQGVNFDDLSESKKYFTPGDELYLKGAEESNNKVWVSNVISGDENSGLKFIDKNGDQVNGVHDILLVRSGYRNQQTTPIGSVSTLTNPIVNDALVFTNVLNAGAVEFSDDWKGFFCYPCDGQQETTNPYLRGELGNYRMKRSYVFLTDRIQSNKDRNTNIRKDGTFKMFTPYWVPNKGFQFIKNPTNWTFVSEVTKFSPYGFELENRDALGRYTSADYGYNNTLPLCVSSNAEYKEIGFTGFEHDNDADNCERSDENTHFKFKSTNENVTEEHSHTGRFSIGVGANQSVEMEKIIIPCQE